MRRLLLPFVLALVALVATGCGSSDSDSARNDGASQIAAADGTPGGVDLLASAVEAGQGLGSAHYVLDASVTVSGDGSNPELALFAQGPITLHVEGDASEGALTADGSVGFAGKTFAGTLLAGQHEAFFNFMGQWYGTKEGGLAEAADQSGERAADDPQQVIRAMREQFDDILQGEVVAGPTVDGDETWRFEGTLDAVGILALSQKLGGRPITAEEARQLEVIADAIRITADFGRDDSLPRHIEFGLTLRADDLVELAGTAGLSGVESIDARVVVDVSDFGKEVTYEAPEQFAPFEDLFGQLFGLLAASGT